MLGKESGEVVTQQFNGVFKLLHAQLKAHTSELSSKFDKAANDAEFTLSVSKQPKKESELKFVHPGNERNYKFNLDILDLLRVLLNPLRSRRQQKLLC